ncbi:hypothetical protein [Gloeothece verrucosa]|uniref:SMODS and SLOG-associating 2TM effector domain-containing protein n=1 Tax=Gloeothece verrucosa (strain PCC 7822) TaxID=497965 RepID=E0UA19_GLOV7|nr:hypothetical protein [Gloeothece verrucosa]ADN16211.1 hypothetical protein Cyan7822_4294 [Gloeothece verrucosa PCC 7822]
MLENTGDSGSRSRDAVNGFKPEQFKPMKLYQKIKKRCSFQKNFSWFLLCVFFVLQYSLPIFLVVLGSLTASQEPVANFLNGIYQQGNLEADSKKTETLVSEIIFILGILTIFLGVTNTTIRPAESYDISAKFNNKFAQFEIDLDIEMSKFFTQKEDNCSEILKLLQSKNEELAKIIERYNEDRSLRPRQADIDLLNQKIEKLMVVQEDKNNMNNSK